MKLAGTLKLEIIKPLDCSWDEAGGRMRAMRRALAAALNETQRRVWPDLQDSLEAFRAGRKDEGVASKQAALGKVRKILKEAWNRQLARDEEWRAKNGVKRCERDAVPVLDCIASETEKQLSSRWEGDHLKALLKLEDSVPSFRGGQTVYAEARHCSVEGKPDEAVLAFPLWQGGSNATRFAVAPVGGSARALWNKLVVDAAGRKELTELERAAKSKDPIVKERAALELEERASIKLGRVGFHYDERRRKWFALLSWTQHIPDGHRELQAAACNFGSNVFVQAVAEDGEDFKDPGADILAVRARFRARRRSIQQSLRFSGTGARGRGSKRRNLPITKIDDAEQRWCKTRIRHLACTLIKWCLRHRVSELYLEDLKGLREDFERQTDGSADSQVKRLIHSWPFYETQQAIEYEALQTGGRVRVLYKKAVGVSRRCPECGHEEPDNVKVIDRSGGAPELLRPNPSGGEPLRYRQVLRESWFECKACSCKGPGDVVACCNHLADVGKSNALYKRQEKARKRVSKIRERVGSAASSASE